MTTAGRRDWGRVLAWTLEERLSAGGTRKPLGEARQDLPDGTKVSVMTDGGAENLVVHRDAELAAVAEHLEPELSAFLAAFPKLVGHTG